jgi:hemerythrin superfamily protein
MMHSKFDWHGNFRIPEALKRGHDEARAELVRASTMHGQIGEEAGRVASFCLPHFEREEETVFPVFGLLRELAAGNVRPEMADVLPMISAFSEWRDSLGNDHLSVAPAIRRLLLAGYKEGNREIVEFTYCLRMHERLEEEVIFPTVLLIGNYVRARLGV